MRDILVAVAIAIMLYFFLTAKIDPQGAALVTGIAIGQGMR